MGVLGVADAFRLESTPSACGNARQQRGVGNEARQRWLTRRLSSGGGVGQVGRWWAEQGVEEMEGWIEEVVRKGGREGETGIEGLSL